MNEIHLKLSRHSAGFCAEIERICQKYENVPLDTPVLSVKNGIIIPIKSKDDIKKTYYNQSSSSGEDSAHKCFSNDCSTLDDEDILDYESLHEDEIGLESCDIGKSPHGHSVFNMQDYSDDDNMSVLTTSHMKAISKVCTAVCKDSVNKTAYINISDESSSGSGTKECIEGLFQTSNVTESDSDAWEDNMPCKHTGMQRQTKCFDDFWNIPNRSKTHGFGKYSQERIHKKSVNTCKNKTTLSSKYGDEIKNRLSRQTIMKDFSSDKSNSDYATKALNSGYSISQVCRTDYTSTVQDNTSNSSLSSKTANASPLSKKKEKAHTRNRAESSIDILSLETFSHCLSNPVSTDETNVLKEKPNSLRSPSIVLSSPLRKMSFSSATHKKPPRASRSVSYAQQDDDDELSLTERTSTSVTKRNCRQNGKQAKPCRKVLVSKTSKTKKFSQDTDSSSADDWFDCKKSNKPLSQLPRQFDGSDDDFAFEYKSFDGHFSILSGPRSTCENKRSFKHNVPVKVCEKSSSVATSSDNSEDQFYITPSNSFEKPTLKSSVKGNSKYNRQITSSDSNDDFTSCSDELRLQDSVSRDSAYRLTRPPASLNKLQCGSSQLSKHAKRNCSLKIKNVFAKDLLDSSDESLQSIETDQENTLDRKFDVKPVNNKRNTRRSFYSRDRPFKQSEKENIPLDCIKTLGENNYKTDKTCRYPLNKGLSPERASTEHLKKTAMVLRSGKKIRPVY